MCLQGLFAHACPRGQIHIQPPPCLQCVANSAYTAISEHNVPFDSSTIGCCLGTIAGRASEDSVSPQCVRLSDARITAPCHQCLITFPILLVMLGSEHEQTLLEVPNCRTDSVDQEDSSKRSHVCVATTITGCHRLVSRYCFIRSTKVKYT